MIKIVTLNLFLILLNVSAFATPLAQEIIREIIPTGELSNSELKRLRLELEIDGLFIESVKQIQLQGGEIQNIENFSSSIQNNILRSLETRTQKLEDSVKKEIKEILRAILSPKVLKIELRKALNFLKDFAKSKGRTLSTTARRFGLQVAAVYMVTLSMDLSLPFYLIDAGYKTLGAAILFVPISSAVTLTYASVKSSLKYIHLIRKLGIKKSKELFDIYKATRRFTNTSLLEKRVPTYITVNKQQVAITITEKNLMTKMITKLGFDTKQLDYDSLKEYLRSKNMYTGSIRRLDAGQDSKLYKLLRLLRKIEYQEDLDFIADFKNHFGDNVKLIAGLKPHNIATDWFLKVSNAKNFEAFFSLMSDMPKDIPPKTFDMIWREVVIPELAKNITKYGSRDNYLAFRELINQYDSSLRSSFISSIDYKIGPEMNKLFIDYIYSSLIPVNSCYFIFKKKEADMKALFI